MGREREVARRLEELRAAGADALVFPSTSFWWLDHYTGLAAHLRSRYTPVLASERVVMFNLR